MSYATQQALEDAFGAVEIRQVSDRDNSGAADTVAIEAVLMRADSTIDGYLAGRYALPLVTPPPAIIATACDLARYWLYDDAAPEQVRKRYEDAIAWLREVAKGTVFLPLAPVTAAASPVGSPDFSAPARVWDATTLAGY